MEKIDRKEEEFIFDPAADKGATVYAIGCDIKIPLQKIRDFFELECGAKKVFTRSYGNAKIEELKKED